MTKNYNSNILPKSIRQSVLKASVGFALVAGSLMTKAQVATYGFNQNNGTFVPVTGGTIVAQATGNTAATNLAGKVYNVALPFGFTFNGITYQSINISSYGFITFGAVAPAETLSLPLSSTTNTGYDGAVSILGKSVSSFYDVNGVTGDIRVETVGTGNNREFVIQWTNFRPSSTTSATAVYAHSYQIRLKETSNKIDMVYGPGSYLAGSTTVSGSAQIGLRGTSTADYNNRLSSSSTAFSNSTEGTAASSTQYISTSATSAAGVPPAGLTYTWTPPTCLAPTALAVSNVTSTTADVTWSTLSTPANGFDYYLSTSNTAPSATYFPTGLSATNNLALTNLDPNTEYYLWARSICSTTDYSGWSQVTTFKTTCNSLTYMFENFDSYSTGNKVPDCWERIMGSSNTAQTISSTSPASGTRNLYQIASSTANSSIVVLPVFSNVNAGTNWLRFKARVASGNGSLDLGYVTDVADANSFQSLKTITFSNTAYDASSEQFLNVPTTVPANARLAIRNAGVSTVGHFWDDVYWEPIPTCYKPTSLTSSNVGSSTATISWTAPTTAPANGYDIYYSNTNTAPTANTAPSVSGVAATTYNLTQLTPTSGYYIWVRSNCGSGDVSEWVETPIRINTTCVAPALLSSNGATVCVNGIATLTASVDAGANAVWYDAPTGGNLLAVGNNYTTPALSSTTSYYVAASTGAGLITGAKAAPVSSPTSGAGTTDFGIVFDVLTPTTIKSVTIYPSASTAGLSGTVTIEVIDANSNVIGSKVVDVITGTTAAPNPHDVELDFTVPAGIDYRMRMSAKSSSVSGLLFDPAASAPNGDYGYPMAVGSNISIKHSKATGTTPRLDLYYYFYNWKVGSGCEAPRVEVIATVDTNCLGTSEVTANNGVKVYPNPFTDAIALTNSADVKSVAVSDASGRVVKTFDKVVGQLNLSELNAGMYILNIQFKNGTNQAVKVIKK